MNILKFFIGGLIGALIGASIWAAISHYASFEIGWIAWGIGILAGFGVRTASNHGECRSAGVVAVLCALIGLLGGKFAGAYLDVHSMSSGTTEIEYEQHAKAYLANDVVESWTAADREITWPRGAAPYEAWKETDYPSSIWTKAKAEWNSMDGIEQASLLDDTDSGLEEHAISMLADDYATDDNYEYDESLNWPRGTAPYSAWEQTDYPSDVWEETIEQWDAMDDAGRASLINEARFVKQGAEIWLAFLFFKSSFSFFDLLWFGFAVYSAWHLAANDKLT